MEPGKLAHDIRADLHSLTTGVQAIEINWETNPELCDRLMELMRQKVESLEKGLRDYRAGANIEKS